MAIDCLSFPRVRAKAESFVACLPIEKFYGIGKVTAVLIPSEMGVRIIILGRNKLPLLSDTDQNTSPEPFDFGSNLI